MICWLKKPNLYLVLDAHSKQLLDLYYAHPKKDAFIKQLSKHLKVLDASAVYNDLCQFQKQLEQASNSINTEIPKIGFQKERKLNYAYNNQSFEVCYSEEIPLLYCLNKIEYLKVKPQNIDSNTYFKLSYSKNDEIVFNKNNNFIGCWQQKHIHEFDGKFAFELLNSIHYKTEQDWIGTFHASTIGNGEQAVMLVGNSGSGKSTLATLLMYAGYDLIADDISGMFADNNHIAVLPAAISVKEKAFSTLSQFITNFKDLPTQYINSNKGNVTYVPPLPLKDPKKLNYPCKNIVLVRYSHSPIPTTLTEGAEKTILEELISESWLANKEDYAQSFLNWLGTLRFYELRYHNNEEAIAAIDSLFK